MFIANYDPLPLAVDCTIVTPTRIADISRAKPTSKAFYAELMDYAAANKLKMYSHLCAAAGWMFRPFVTDSYGGIRADARHMIGQLITLSKKFMTEEESTAYSSSAWINISAAAVSRAGIQLCAAHAVINSSLHTPAQGFISEDISTSSSACNDMGNVTSFQPSQPAEVVVANNIDVDEDTPVLGRTPERATWEDDQLQAEVQMYDFKY